MDHFFYNIATATLFSIYNIKIHVSSLVKYKINGANKRAVPKQARAFRAAWLAPCKPELNHRASPVNSCNPTSKSFTSFVLQGSAVSRFECPVSYFVISPCGKSSNVYKLVS